MGEHLCDTKGKVTASALVSDFYWKYRLQLTILLS